MQKSLKQNIKCPVFAHFKSVQSSSSNTETHREHVVDKYNIF